ncbi:hypothetical protein NDU88_012780 [Pleurodeles waltl]|uniref:Uncharacterized protein n=1 Tax=Pleurodeles waltl TaxID=8319 RepID=A0AAV7R127_PLEWA|nr:hypothetical protein NDU88_012780 [Pleurodeles waltl]
MGPGTAAVACGPPAPSPEQPAASRKAAASRKRRGRKPPLFLTSVLRQRLGRAGNPSATQRSCSDEERPGLARSTGFFPLAPPELEN